MERRWRSRRHQLSFAEIERREAEQRLQRCQDIRVLGGHTHLEEEQVAADMVAADSRRHRKGWMAVAEDCYQGLVMENMGYVCVSVHIRRVGK